MKGRKPKICLVENLSLSLKPPLLFTPSSCCFPQGLVLPRGAAPGLELFFPVRSQLGNGAEEPFP